MFKIAIFLLFIFTFIFKVSSLNCYVCNDCDQVKDEYVASCEDLGSITTSTSTSTTTTTTEPTTNSNEPTTTTNPELPTTITVASVFVNRDDITNNTYECVQGKITVNNTQMTVRDCIVNRGNGSCESFGLASCSVCSTDQCNGAGSINYPVILLAVSFFTSLLKE